MGTLYWNSVLSRVFGGYRAGRCRRRSRAGARRACRRRGAQTHTLLGARPVADRPNFATTPEACTRGGDAIFDRWLEPDRSLTDVWAAHSTGSSTLRRLVQGQRRAIPQIAIVACKLQGVVVSAERHRPRTQQRCVLGATATASSSRSSTTTSTTPPCSIAPHERLR